MINIIKYSDFKDNNYVYLLPAGIKYEGISKEIYDRYKVNRKIIYVNLQKSLKLMFVGVLNKLVNDNVTDVVIPLGNWNSDNELEDLKHAVDIIDSAKLINIICVIE